MKKAKRALALALVFALVASFCVTGAAAAPGPGNEDSHVINGEAVTQDGVTVSKTARYVDKNEYEITLSVTIPADVTVPGSSADVVLVIDRSGSMDDGGMPVSTLDRNGVSAPHTRPYTGPHISPHNSTGICIGKNTWPALGTAWNASGNTRPSATHSALMTSLRVLFIYIPPIQK